MSYKRIRKGKVEYVKRSRRSRSSIIARVTGENRSKYTDISYNKKLALKAYKEGKPGLLENLGVVKSRSNFSTGTYTRTRRGKKEIVRKRIYIRMSRGKGEFRIGGGFKKEAYLKGRLVIRKKRDPSIKNSFKIKLNPKGIIAKGKNPKVTGSIAAGIKDKKQLDLIGE